jgi:hypothetical protein
MMFKKYKIISGRIDGKETFSVGLDLSRCPSLREDDEEQLFDLFDKIWNSGMFEVEVEMFGVDGEELPDIAALRAERDRLREVLDGIEGVLAHIENTGEVIVGDIEAIKKYITDTKEGE